MDEQQLREIIQTLICEIKKKRVVRAGKRIRKKIAKSGYKIVGDKQVKMKSKERFLRKRAQKKGARKRKRKKSQILRKRKISMRKVRR